ncbi:YgiQ family radical SAM protein [Hornefia butyriciproducens]|uniref:YgiQ family radical SAM protein n=1 Tax=Hornefia butyriciproducens TaxID=2652293 RepID=A0A6L5Y4V3_9FIRM|nr:YgiQ family radical SAM protein [Hornefia butyriciproducens]MDD6298612.1 YgiQ family radical SAM protein [Hornefia butyriciproducens]MDY5422743.1 YgiQ family radical SAM protein [Hornefia butyriciproducens]MST51561.1 YgiQ family radical SAM protein [Hornefia butyriciproducens]
MFLPINRKEMEERGWEQPDFVLVTGDAYVDHHSFGTAIISRLLERFGYKVAVLAQPDFRSCEDFRRFGRPRLGFLINSGVVDSMVNHYSVFRHRRRVDEYSPGGVPGKRPDRAVIVYSNRAREAYRDVPVIIGGIEASLRRLGHYDYWDDRVRRSILLDSRADLLIYGMGERAVLEIAEALDSGIHISDITWIRGTCYRTREFVPDEQSQILPAFEEIAASRDAYAESFAMQYRENDPICGRRLAEPYGEHSFVVQNLPQEPLTRQELDDLYELPYENEEHPMYRDMGGIPAFREVKFSLVSSRGCFGGCSFCALTYHQGRQVRSRSRESLVREAEKLIRKPDFRGYIHDVGGPTANFRGPACDKQLKYGVCRGKDCLYPKPCRSMKIDHSDYLEVLKAIRELPGVKKVFIRSGIRYDYLMADPKRQKFMDELCAHHVSGTLKVAPEHIAQRALHYMGKPSADVFTEFVKQYRQTNRRLNKKQYLIPYLISSHPGCTLEDAVDLALFLKEYGFIPDQVQDFYPTPGTLATAMFYTETDPRTGEHIYVAKSLEDKKMQRALIHYNRPENRRTVLRALEKAGRKDLIPVLLTEGRRNGNTKGSHKGHRTGTAAGRKHRKR